MELVKLGKRGQVSIPRAVLRQAGVYPLEIYGEERLREFGDADRLTAGESASLKRKLKPRR